MLSCPSSTPIPCLNVSSPRRPSAHAAATLLVHGVDEVPIQRIPPHSDTHRQGKIALLHFPPFCLPSPFLASLWPWPMPSWVCLTSICGAGKPIIKSMQQVVAEPAQQFKCGAMWRSSSSKHTLDEVSTAGDRVRMTKVWRQVPELQQVALRLLYAHAMRAETKCSWCLWGRIHCAARSSLGMQRAKA
jgi:hypothetical protein